MMTALLEKHDIDSPYMITRDHIQFYRKNGYIKLKDVLSEGVLEFYGREITNKVIELNTQDTPMEERTTYNQAFLQVTNIWRESEIVKEFVFGKRLGHIASDLMETDGARLYHDQALYKEAGGGFTPWHADQFYWPLASDKSITVWVPLQEIPLEMGPVAFSPGSHKLRGGRDMEISDESEEKIQRLLDEQGFGCDHSRYDLGEVSFHAGWTYHRAHPNKTDRARQVMTIIYIDRDMRLAEPKNDNQVGDRNGWCPGIEIGEIIDSHLNPVLYSRERDD